MTIYSLSDIVCPTKVIVNQHDNEGQYNGMNAKFSSSTELMQFMDELRSISYKECSDNMLAPQYTILLDDVEIVVYDATRFKYNGQKWIATAGDLSFLDDYVYFIESGWLPWE